MTMFVEIDPHSPRPVYLQIVDAIRRAIAVGALVPGDKLPTIRDVAVQARVNRNTVSRAYLELEHLGYVVNRQGSGCYVTASGSGLPVAERKRALRKLVDALLVEAHHYRIPTETLIDMVREGAAAFDKERQDE